MGIVGDTSLGGSLYETIICFVGFNGTDTTVILKNRGLILYTNEIIISFI
jgi:hypothetical protein